MKTINQVLSLLIVSLFLFNCENSSSSNDVKEEQVEEIDLKDQVELLSKLYTPDNLPEQSFKVKPNKDTSLVGENGTVIQIFKNSFVDENGEIITEAVEVTLKEALDPLSIVNAGLTTTSNGQKLQTGGMIYLNAKSGNKTVSIAENSPLGVMIPNDDINLEMKIFKGEQTEKGMNWVAPESLLNEDIEKLKKIKNESKPKQEEEKVEGNSIDAIFGFVDSTEAGGFVKEVPRPEDVPQFGRFTKYVEQKGTNYFSVDHKTSYIFEMKDLGWANIDRLFSDPRTQLVELLTEIKNASEFDKVYITMVISEMYLPGYQMKNGDFSFTHGDTEKPKLPVGEKAVIFATAYKNNKPHFDILTTQIKEKETITLNLAETTEDELRTKLKGNL